MLPISASAELSRAQIVASFYSTTCPHCQGIKEKCRTLCRAGYFALPAAMQRRLYSPMGKGYEKAVNNALKFLKAGRNIQAAIKLADESPELFAKLAERRVS